MSRPASVLIVGGGIAGYTAATALRSGGYDGAVTIVEAERLAYDRPPLSKDALVADSPLESLAFASAADLAAQRIELLADVAATEIGRGTVTLADGRVLRAEHLVVATGAQVRQPDFPGAESSRVVTLRTYQDAARIRAVSLPSSTIVVLGGGFIGAEIAASLRTLGAHVVLADRNDIPGQRVLGETLAGWLHSLHAAHGVDVRVAAVDSVVETAPAPRPHTNRGGHLVPPRGDATAESASSEECARSPLEVRLTDGSTVTANLLVAGIGMAPQIPLPGVEHSDTVIAPSDHWDDARLDGLAAAARILGSEPPPRGTPWYWSDRYGHHVEVVGRLVGEADSDSDSDSEEIVRWAEPGRPSAVFRLDGEQLVGAASIDDPNTVRAARRLIDQGVPVTATALRDSTISLRDLLRAAR